MLSTTDLERLIAVKRREIEKEKTRLGLSPRLDETSNKENAVPKRTEKKVSEERVLKQNGSEGQTEGVAEEIPPDLERYIRRYLGLPVMLKAGEYSPNNPLVRGERAGAGDALLGLGEYERRRNTLRKLRQQQYREYLDEQAKKKQEEKEKADRERREREEREREREQREREKERERAERDRLTPERPRAYTSTVFSAAQNFTSKVDTGVQTTGAGRPLSVAVQTDDAELYRERYLPQLSPSPTVCGVTQAERELSPRTVATDHRRSLPDVDLSLRRTERYKPSLLDADAVQQRNELAEQEAAAKRQFYQQELRNQILEQQRIREERKAREKLLEAAEMRRLEEQLRMLRAAQDSERGRHAAGDRQMKENATDYEKKRTALQKEIDLEKQSLLRIAQRRSHTSHSDNQPFYCPTVHKGTKEKKHYSTNIPDTSIFSPNYDVDTYLRKNLNPSKETLSRLDTSTSECLASKYLANYDRNKYFDRSDKNDRLSDSRVVVEKALVHDRPKQKYEPSNENDNPIPVLRHSPVNVKSVKENTDLSEAMQVVDDKWKVPIVQKNILRSQPNEEGKSVSILTQLGSIRRQLQLEQLKLDKMLTKDDA